MQFCRSSRKKVVAIMSSSTCVYDRCFSPLGQRMSFPSDIQVWIVCVLFQASLLFIFLNVLIFGREQCNIPSPFSALECFPRSRPYQSNNLEDLLLGSVVLQCPLSVNGQPWTTCCQHGLHRMKEPSLGIFLLRIMFPWAVLVDPFLLLIPK